MTYVSNYSQTASSQQPSQSYSVETSQLLLDSNIGIKSAHEEKIDAISSLNGNCRTTEATTKNVKCFYTNADQLRNKLDELNLQISLEEPDFISVTEVLPKVDSDLDCSSILYKIDNYVSFPIWKRCYILY